MEEDGEMQHVEEQDPDATQPADEVYCFFCGDIIWLSDGMYAHPLCDECVWKLSEIRQETFPWKKYKT